MTNPIFMQGEAAAELTGKTIGEIDEAAATGAIPAHYVGWQLLVCVDDLPEPGPTEEQTDAETWDDLTVAELKAELDERQIEYPSKALKADLVEILNADDEGG